MAAEGAVSQTEKADASPEPLLSKHDWILIAVVVLAQMPLLSMHFMNLWRYPHYQYFPIVLAGFVWLLWTRRPENGQSEFIKRPVLDAVTLVLGMAFMAVALVAFSPWLAAIAAIFFTGHFMSRFSTTDPVCNFLGIWALLWLLIPIPLGFDTDLIQWLQSQTSTVASKLLDLMAVNHLMAGNVVELPTQKLFVDEACSGIQSFFALLACTALYVVWNYRPVLHAWLLIASTLVWCVIMNVARVVTIAAYNDNISVDLATGWGHEVLGLVIFAITLLLMASTDNMLAFLFGPIGSPTPGQRNPYNWNPLSRAWNFLIARQLGTDEEQAAGLGIDEDDSLVTPARTKPFGIGRLAWTAGLLAFAVIGLAETVLIAQHASQQVKAEQIEKPASEQALALTEEDLPEKLAGWSQLAFNAEKRTTGSIYGEYSRTWTYAGTVAPDDEKRRTRQFLTIVSLDFPFGDRHDLTKCYRGRGWNIESQKTIRPKESDAAAYVRFELRNDFGERGLVLYSHFNAAGEEFTTPGKDPGDLAKRAADRTNRDPELDPISEELAYYQIQTFVPTLFELSKEEIAEIEKRFFEARRRLQVKVQSDAADK